MNKKGFTLIELIATIAILSILILIVVPNALKIYNNSVLKSMEVQENNILDASNLFITDRCKNKISSDYVCPTSYLNEENNKKYVCLNEIQTAGYMDVIKYKGTSCKGLVVYTKNDAGKYANGKTYLYCGTNGSYSYTTENAPAASTYSGKCGL